MYCFQAHLSDCYVKHILHYYPQVNAICMVCSGEKKAPAPDGVTRAGRSKLMQE